MFLKKYMLYNNHDKKGDKMKLKDIAELQTGLVLNRKQATRPDEVKVKYKQLNLKSVDSSGFINLEMLEDFESKESLKREYFTRKGDIVVRLSYPYTAVIIDEESENLLVPSHFVIIRCDQKIIVPGYLGWLLNSDKMKKKISLSTSTSAFGTIKQSFYSDLEIYSVPTEKQKILSEINRLSVKETMLLTELKDEKQKYYETLISKLQKEMRNK